MNAPRAKKLKLGTSNAESYPTNAISSFRALFNDCMVSLRDFLFDCSFSTSVVNLLTSFWSNFLASLSALELRNFESIPFLFIFEILFLINFSLFCRITYLEKKSMLFDNVTVDGLKSFIKDLGSSAVGISAVVEYNNEDIAIPPEAFLFFCVIDFPLMYVDVVVNALTYSSRHPYSCLLYFVDMKSLSRARNKQINKSVLILVPGRWLVGLVRLHFPVRLIFVVDINSCPHKIILADQITVFKKSKYCAFS
mmetsp:Transcript_13924/g.16922  ORF Transcript_13924/g.16922 Transcript_13924/m.16922 type:complete len:252 (-) Transcript_13924:59-814(-)